MMGQITKGYRTKVTKDQEHDSQETKGQLSSHQWQIKWRIPEREVEVSL